MAVTVFSQTISQSCSGSEIIVKQTFNLDHRLYTLQKYVVCKSLVRNGPHVHGNLKSRGFYRFFINRNVIPFYFHFLQRMLSHLLSNFIGSKILSVMPLISQSSEIKSKITESF